MTTTFAGIGAAVAALGLIIWYLANRPIRGCACGRCHRSITVTPRCRLLDGNASAWLEFRTGPMEGRKVQLVERRTRIGSVADNEVVLSDPAVSQQHVVIDRHAGAFTLYDLSSTNGVYVNGVRESKMVLASDDILKIGNSEVVLRFF